MGEWEYKKLFLIHIRDYYLDDNKKHMPSKNGIALTMDTWNIFMENIQAINNDA